MKTSRGWRKLGGQLPGDLVEERLQLHWAAQALSSITHAALPARPGDHHTSLGWDHETQALVTHPFTRGKRASLVVPEFTLQWTDPDGTTLERFPLEGQTLDTARLWITDLARPFADGLPSDPVPLRDYDMPKHAVAAGRPFSGGDPLKRTELARWFANADLALAEIATNHEGVDVRIWPHHFDVGLLITLDPDKDPEQARSIGVGMSSGDTKIPQPYYYVYPYPAPEGKPLPDLPGGGRWEKDAFFGALLTGEILSGDGVPNQQRENLQTFLGAAVESARALLVE